MKNDSLNQVLSYISNKVHHDNKKDLVKAVGTEVFKTASLGAVTYLASKAIDIWAANNNTRLF